MAPADGEARGVTAPHPSLLIGVRVALALLTLVAIGRQLTIHVSLGLSVINFFSYFTNLSNLFAAIVLLWGARGPGSHGATGPPDRVRAIAATQMTVVGVVFAILLRDVDLGALEPWVNVVLHYVMPCAIVIDWMVQPPRARLEPRDIVICLAFPAVYLSYVLLRGSAAGWYPYPFLNPALMGGYGGVAVYAVGIALAFLAAGWSLVALGNARRNAGRA